MISINEDTYAEGLAAYTRGETLRELVVRAEAIETRLPDDDGGAVPSIVVGFIDGLIADIRRLQ